MIKRLYRTAFISSPILALIGATPIYVIEGYEISTSIIVWFILTISIFIFWSINIRITTKVRDFNGYKRYLLSYFFILMAQRLNFFIITNCLDIKPPPYIILPFIGAIALNTVIIIISNAIIFQFQKENADLEIEILKVSNLEAQKQMLLQQLQPHFLFNTLSTLKSLISENPNNAEDYVVRLSDFLRYSIQGKNNEIVSIEEELKFTKDYFNLQKVRFGDALQFFIEIPTDILKKKIPVYAIQTLVENAIKHNSFTEKKPLHIRISTQSINDNIFIKIENNKLPKALHLPSGIGLENLNLRYKMISGNEIEVIETEENFIVHINIL